jgi:hypothetical protein
MLKILEKSCLHVLQLEKIISMKKVISKIASIMEFKQKWEKRKLMKKKSLTKVVLVLTPFNFPDKEGEKTGQS